MPSRHLQEGKESVLDTIQKTFETAVQDDPANGVYRVSRDIFADPQIFELPQVAAKTIFYGSLSVRAPRFSCFRSDASILSIWTPSQRLVVTIAQASQTA